MVKNNLFSAIGFSSATPSLCQIQELKCQSDKFLKKAYISAPNLKMIHLTKLERLEYLDV